MNELSGTRVLVIEDEDPVRSNLIELLEEEGFFVLGAENGSVGVEQARCFHPDLVICDIMLPRLDGYGVLAIFRQETELSSIPFIFLTAKTERLDIRSAMELGADDYITKPYTRAEILKTIQTRLKKKADLSLSLEKTFIERRGRLSQQLPYELMNPLLGILNKSEILTKNAEHYNPLQVGEISRDIHRSALNLLKIVQNYLLLIELNSVVADDMKLAQMKNSRTASACSTLREMVDAKIRHEMLASSLEYKFEDMALQITAYHLQVIVEEALDYALYNRIPDTKIRLDGVAHQGKYELVMEMFKKDLNVIDNSFNAGDVRFVGGLTKNHDVLLNLSVIQRLVELYAGQYSFENSNGKITLRICLMAA
jgi:two-component system sensor histidine kinase/response regulator